jgi:hypothetical protein
MRPADTRQPGARVAAHWLAIPVGHANMAALSVTACVMVLLAGHEAEGLDAAAFVRTSALALIAVHAGFHSLTVNVLKFMELLDVAEATPALRAYRDPRRVSHLDLAALWLAYYALTPYVIAV